MPVGPPKGNRLSVDKIWAADKHGATNVRAIGGSNGARIIDISVALENDIASDPPGQEPKITYVDHKQSAPEVCKFFPGLTPADLPDGEGWAVESIDISTHNGTHLDAPWHFASTMDGGQARRSRIDEIPLDWCSSPA